MSSCFKPIVSLPRTENCDYFFWVGAEGIFGVETTKNKCHLAKFTEEKTFLDIKMTMTPQEGAVSGFKGCKIDV